MSEYPHGDIAPPRIVPQSWAAGVNLQSAEDRDDKGDGPYEVRMTFAESDKEAVRTWLKWLTGLDPKWGGKP